jgi:hypothetical protein
MAPEVVETALVKATGQSNPFAHETLYAGAADLDARRRR